MLDLFSIALSREVVAVKDSRKGLSVDLITYHSLNRFVERFDDGHQDSTATSSSVTIEVQSCVITSHANALRSATYEQLL
jgi:hypothetical protein